MPCLEYRLLLPGEGGTCEMSHSYNQQIYQLISDLLLSLPGIFNRGLANINLYFKYIRMKNWQIHVKYERRRDDRLV